MRTRPAAARLPWGFTVAALGVAVWLIANPRTPDLAGQVYRANLFGEIGFAVWDGDWYAGHDLPGYSLLFPPLAALVGVRVVGAFAVLVSATLFERVAGTIYGREARWGATWFALAALGDVWSGRVTFALGVSFALAAILAFARDGARRTGGARRGRGALASRGARAASAAGIRGWTPLAGALGAACAACSPVAGALLGLAGLTHSLATRSPRGLLVLGLPPAAVVLALVGLFPEGGWEPYPLLPFLATVTAVLGFLLVVPREQRLLRVGAAVYLAVCAVCVVVHTPMGGNIERYGVLLAGPLLVCALLTGARSVGGHSVEAGGRVRGGVEVGSRARSAGGVDRGVVSGARKGRGAGVRRWVAAAVLCGIATWTAWGPVRETAAVAGESSTSASYYVPVEHFVAGHGGELVRVEVPFTRGHWEAAWLAQRVLLARGWEKQLDERYDGVLLSKGLTAAQYHSWLRELAVSYVALPDAPLDPSSVREGRLIRGGLPYLREVWRTRHWRIYALLDPMRLAQGPGALSGMGHSWFALRARAAGRFVVRVRYTRYWTVTRGAACVSSAPGGWTAVTARAAGTVRVAARFSLGRALGLDTGSCRRLGGLSSGRRSQWTDARSYRPV